jgi:hypothetical protein
LRRTPVDPLCAGHSIKLNKHTFHEYNLIHGTISTNVKGDGHGLDAIKTPGPLFTRDITQASHTVRIACPLVGNYLDHLFLSYTRSRGSAGQM